MDRLAAQDPLHAADQQRQIDHRVQKEGVPNGVPQAPVAEYVNQGGNQSTKVRLLAGLAEQPEKSQSGQIHSQMDQQPVGGVEIPHRTEQGEQIEGIAQHVIVQGGQNVVSLSQRKAPLRNAEAFPGEQTANRAAQRCSVPAQGREVLPVSVKLPDDRPFGQIEPVEAEGGEDRKAERILPDQTAKRPPRVNLRGPELFVHFLCRLLSNPAFLSRLLSPICVRMSTAKPRFQRKKNPAGSDGSRPGKKCERLIS